MPEKTSLLRGLLNLVPVDGGEVLIDEQPVTTLSAAERARLLAYLPQRRPVAWPNRVHDLIALGRFAHGATLGRLGSTDRQAVEQAIHACDLGSLANRSVSNLSGGELARVHFARALAAATPLLLADEPVAALDPRHQLQVATLLRRFVANGGGALIVLHELALAAKIANRLIWMKEGRIVADGSPQETLTPAMMRRVFGVAARITEDEDGFDIRVLEAH